MKTMEKKGFTLIELLIVIAIIGILAVAFLPSLLGAPAKGRDAQRLATLQKIQNFLVTEMLSGSTLPVSGCIVGGTNPTPIGTLIENNIANFGGVFPTDPQTDMTTGTSNPACSSGAYGFINFTTVGADYSVAVFAGVEELDNANIPCAGIDDVAGITLSTPDPANDELCHILLIQ